MPSKVTLSLTYHEVAHRLLLSQTEEQIAQAMSLEVTAVQGILNRKDFKPVLDELRDKAYAPMDRQIESKKRNIQLEIEDHAGESFDRLVTLMGDTKSDGIAKDIAQDFLNRAGIGKQAGKAPLMTVNINPIHAKVITGALALEQEGESLLRLRGLVKRADEIDHPVLKREEAADSPENASNASKQPTGSPKTKNA